MENVLQETDWLTLTQFFPLGWEDKAKELGVMERKRKFKNPSDVLRLLLMHYANNCSMKEAVTRAKLGGLISISDVALLKKIRSSAEWFRWMSIELLSKRGVNIEPPEEFKEYNIRSIDASVITEPGSTGTDWRLHYSLEMLNLKCDEFMITRPETGESFINYNVNKNDILIGDRVYSRYKSMLYVKNKGGFFITRYMHKAINFYDNDGNMFKINKKLKALRVGKILEIDCFVSVGNNEKLPIRICAIKKSEKQGNLSVKKAIYEQKKKQRKINPETIELHRYVIIITSLPTEIPALKIMELYRLRWQIEIAFKRLKSIFGLGHLPKKDIESARGWLQGKLFVALLAQTIVDESYLFSPWGYPLSKRQYAKKMFVA